MKRNVYADKKYGPMLSHLWTSQLEKLQLTIYCQLRPPDAMALLLKYFGARDTSYFFV